MGSPVVPKGSEGAVVPSDRAREGGQGGQGVGHEGENTGSSCPSSETVMTKSEKPVRRSARWRYQMELPEEGEDDCAEKLWDFVGAHVEDKRREKACVLASKVWKTLSRKAMGGHQPRDGGEVLGIPVAMPGRLASWRRGGKQGQIRWTHKYATRAKTKLERRSGLTSAGLILRAS